jgi:hypothetical protein
MHTYVHLISFVWIWPCEKLFKICFLLRSKYLRFEGIGSGSDFRECGELCLVFSFRLFSNMSVRHVCRRKGGKWTKRSGVCLLRCKRSHFFYVLMCHPMIGMHSLFFGYGFVEVWIPCPFTWLLLCVAICGWDCESAWEATLPCGERRIWQKALESGSTTQQRHPTTHTHVSNSALMARYQPCLVVAHDKLPSPLGNICGFSGLLTIVFTNIATEQRPVKSTCDSTISSNASKTLPGDTDKCCE